MLLQGDVCTVRTKMVRLEPERAHHKYLVDRQKAVRRRRPGALAGTVGRTPPMTASRPHTSGGGKERRAPDVAHMLMVIATASLAAVSLSSVGLMHLLLPAFDRGNVLRHGAADMPPAPTESSPPSSTPAPAISNSLESFSQEAFLELVKRRVNIKTPLDTTFWRPYVRGVAKDAGKNPAGHQTQLIFVAGAEGTGHHFITALMMRLSQLMPMTLVEEQMFQALWWNPKARDPAKFWSALESFQQWVQVATHRLLRHRCVAYAALPTLLQPCLEWLLRD